MEKRALLAFVLSMAIFVVWALVYTPKSKPPVQGQGAATQVESETGQALPVAEKAARTAAETLQAEAQAGPAPRADIREITVHTELYTAVFTEAGGRLKSFKLNKYRSANNLDSPPKELVTADSDKDLPLGLFFRAGQGPKLKNAYFKADREGLDLTGAAGQGKLVMTFEGPDHFQVIKTYTFRTGSYLIDLEVRLRNLSPATIDDNLVLELASGPFMKSKRYSFAGFGALIDDDLQEIDIEDLEDDLDYLKKKTYTLTWAAYEDQYFLAGILPQDKDKTRVAASAIGSRGVRIEFINPPLVMPPQTKKVYRFTIFYGPKDYNLLKSLNNGLVRSIYFGWFDILSKPLLIFMIWLHNYVSNYGIVIIIITILIKILFWPLTAKSYKSMKSMQKIQPKIMKLREKYKEDREAMNREMMQLYRTYKVNPMGGCLPMIIQIPVFIALYRLLDYSLELRHSPFWLWIDDLSAPDRLFHFAYKLPLMQEPTGIPVLTLLMGASMLLQQKMTPTPGDPTQAKIMMFMPIFFTFIFINFPAGLVLYWLVNNLLSIGQQYLINKSPS
ncbi:MAG: membrane protein insertase YidC [Thermodesulfobacteriota bacterium]|nr:membrane protein insertase YidC [Thermodesulfobacteriota bacterium]